MTAERAEGKAEQHADSNEAVMAEIPEHVELALQSLSGEVLRVVAHVSDTMFTVRERAAATWGVPSPFLKVLGSCADVDDLTTVVAVQGVPLHMHVFDRVPFEERFFRRQTDGVPLECCGDKIMLTFSRPGCRDSEVGVPFRTRSWASPRPGVARWGCEDDCIELEWLLPEDCPAAVRAAVTPVVAAGRAWRTLNVVMVREAADLKSTSLQTLPGGTDVVVEEGCFLSDEDSTPRLRITSPLDGWVTPYLESTRKLLIRPAEQRAASLADCA